MRERKSIFRKATFAFLSAILLTLVSTPFMLKADEVDDTTPPEIGYGYQTPVDGSMVQGTIVLDANFNDEQGLAAAAIGLGGEYWYCLYDMPESGYQECLVDTTLLPDGYYEVTYWAMNLAGLESTTIVGGIRILNVSNPVLDTQAPEFSLKDVTRDENEMAPDYAEFIQSNPEGLTPVCTGLDYSKYYVAQPNGNTLVPVSCTVTDLAGNSTTATSNLIVNNVQPHVVIIAMPSTNATTGNTITLTANILHGNGSFNYYWTGACSGNGSQVNVGLTNSVYANYGAGSYLCGIVVTDSDGDVVGASVQLDFTTGTTTPTETSTESNTNTDTQTPATTEESTTETPDSTEGQVEGATTDSTVSDTQSTTEPTNTTNTTNNTNATNSTAGTTSPLVIICLVAGGILIIGLLLFLFFRGEDEEEETPAAA